MAKAQKVRYRISGDGIKPGVSDYSAALRAPIEILVRPDESRSLTLGVSFDVACIAVIRGNLLAAVREGKAEARVLTDSGDVVYPNTPISLWVRSLNGSTIHIEEKEAVVDVFPLPRVELEKE